MHALSISRKNRFTNKYISHHHPPPHHQVEYGLCDIQGNTFNSLGGKPFLALQPLSAEQVDDDDDGDDD